MGLVTKNLRDFGVRKLATPGIDVMRPDGFLLGLWQHSPDAEAAAFASLRAPLRSAPSAEQLLQRLAADGQARTATALHDAWQSGSARL